MIRFLIDQFRNMPGPLKKPRILVADLTEEVLDIAEHFLKKGDSAYKDTDCCGCGNGTTAASETAAPPAAPAQPTPVESEASVGTTAPAGPKAKTGGKASDIDPRLAASIMVPANVRKQEFKVLAILWDAYSKNIGALSAKAISKRGEDILNVQIRHENVRKVIRMRLENYVKVHAQGVGNGTVYNYELAEAGAAYFASTYLK
ncbi:MAG: hypothetical protein JXX14_19385 [Deltaproteobacteria bacterium]|nr:hypothetical protein [Deltaproteobacteria bacterium]